VIFTNIFHKSLYVIWCGCEIIFIVLVMIGLSYCKWKFKGLKFYSIGNASLHSCLHIFAGLNPTSTRICSSRQEIWNKNIRYGSQRLWTVEWRVINRHRFINVLSNERIIFNYEIQDLHVHFRLYMYLYIK
jgi:hypothetical protein